MGFVWDKIWKVGLSLWVIVAAYFLLAYRPFSAPSGSMIPNILVGDYFVVSKMAYGLSRFSAPFPLPFKGRIFAASPRRGDVVVFALPRDPNVDFIKRVVGLPGDTVQLKSGRLYINGTMVPREPTAKVTTTDVDGHLAQVPTYEETLPDGTAHRIVELQGDTGLLDNTEMVTVPPDDYFVLGDNRDNSTDSRTPPAQGGVGFVPFENLIGRAEMIVVSHEGGEQTFPFRSIH